MGNVYIWLLICWMAWVSLKPHSRLSVTGLPYATKYTMLCSGCRHHRSIMLMVDAVTLPSKLVTQYSLLQKVYACRDHENYRTAS